MVRGSAESRPEVTMQSRQHTGGFVGRPGQIASAAVWLCSDGASFVNGESMVVDGGTITR
jgi:NAD(P)-dependent dehydrogenase (short-subunit alcohol dehydrogenase family)